MATQARSRTDDSRSSRASSRPGCARTPRPAELRSLSRPGRAPPAPGPATSVRGSSRDGRWWRGPGPRPRRRWRTSGLSSWRAAAIRSSSNRELVEISPIARQAACALLGAILQGGSKGILGRGRDGAKFPDRPTASTRNDSPPPTRAAANPSSVSADGTAISPRVPASIDPISLHAGSQHVQNGTGGRLPGGRAVLRAEAPSGSFRIAIRDDRAEKSASRPPQVRFARAGCLRDHIEGDIRLAHRHGGAAEDRFVPDRLEQRRHRWRPYPSEAQHGVGRGDLVLQCVHKGHDRGLADA